LQENVISDQEVLEHKVSVALKLVQIFVTDKSGKPVGDLDKEDFVLYDNGRLMSITEFEKHFVQVPQTVSEVPDKKTWEKAAPLEPMQLNRKFFILIDANRNDGLGLTKAKKTALHFLNTQILPTDELGLLSYSTDSGLMIHEYLTNDRQRIIDLIDNLRLFPGMSPRSLHMTAENDTDFMSQDEPISGLNMKNALDFTSSLSDFAASLGYIPGYKNILLFSSGIARSILEGEDPRFRFEFEKMVKEITSSNSSIYTIDTQGQRDLIENREEKGDIMLRRMADVSGGRHFVDVDRRETIAEDIQKATGHFYVLGYYVDERWDGSFHEIKVEVKKDGYHIQAQKGYYNPKPFSKFTKLEKELHLKDIAFKDNPYHQLPMEASMFSLIQEDDSQFCLLGITIMPQKAMQEVLEEEAEVISYVLDDKGDIVLEGRKEIDLTKSLNKKICFYSIAELIPGNYGIRIIVRNKKTGKSVRAISRVMLPGKEDFEFEIFPPIILLADTETFYMRSSFDTEDEEGKNQPVKMNPFYAAVLTNHLPLTGVLERGKKHIKVLVSYSRENRESPDIPIKMYLTHEATGDKTQLSPALISSESKGNICAEFLELVLPELDFGKYTLEVEASDPETGENVSAIVTFRVE
jgi:VWFA-related protein